MARNVYHSRGRHNRLGLAWTLALLTATTAAAVGGLYAVGLVAGRGGREAATEQVALVAPSPVPLRNVTVHRNRLVTLTYRVANRGEAIRSAFLVIRKANGSIAKSLDLGPQLPDRKLSHRFRVTLKAGNYTWFVRAGS